MSTPDSNKPPWYHRTYFWALLAIAGYLLWTEHRAHVIAYLPLGLLAACVGMHLLMHGSHGHGNHGATKDSDPESKAKTGTLPSDQNAAEADRRGNIR